MSEDRIEGAFKKAGGRAEDAWGGLTGDAARQAKGKADQAFGSAQEAFGEARDRVQDIYDEVESFAKDQPLQALAVTLAVGAVLGFILRGGRKTVYVRK